MNKPESINKIGDSVFIEKKLYKRNNMKIVYINEELYEQLFHKKYVFSEASSLISEMFSVTLEDTNSLVGTCFIDYQADPTGIALDGNIGSGRAFYMDSNFNIKGDKTPLAVSDDPIYNNGRLSLTSSIAEAITSRVLSKDMKIKTFDTLAILDREERYLYPYAEMDTAYLVRYVKDNEMYRFSHRFVNKIPFTREELIKISNSMGILEANKYMERFIHGAWSLGNISIDSNMIDFDTSYFVQNRNPSFSFTPNYKTNYFGYEYLGDIKILETILDSELNIDNVSIEELSNILIQSRENEIKEELINLLGINHDEDISELTSLFMELSNYFYKYDEAYSVNSPYSNEIALFNFSKLFRYYPLYKYNGYDIKSSYGLVINDKCKTKENNSELNDKVNDFFSGYQVDEIDEEIFDKLDRFIHLYDELITKYLDINLVRKTYLLNEDRSYLYGYERLRYELTSLYKKHGSEYSSKLINLISKFSSRTYTSDNNVCDAFFLENFVIYKRILGDKFRFELVLFNKGSDIGMDKSIYHKEGEVYVSDYFDIANILNYQIDNMHKEKVLGMKKRTILNSSKNIEL